MGGSGRLARKVAIVTGAGTGIGEAIAHKFAKEGAKVVVAGLPSDPIGDVVEHMRTFGAEAIAFGGDLADEVQAKACVETAIRHYGKLDVLVNNAGVFLATAETQDFPSDVYLETIRNNIGTVFMMTRAALPYLQATKGVVLATGSEAGLVGLPKYTVYGATKAWIHAFIQGVAVEQARHGVRANCVCPGAVDTAWTHAETGPMDKKMEKQILSATPLGRRATPEEIANVFAFLASSEASFVTGALWTVDGGITLAKGSVGLEAGKEARRAPEGTLDLEHAHEGLKNKKTRAA